MPYKKGESGNSSGRPKGSKNRITAEMRLALKNVLNREIERIPELLESLDDRERLQIIIKLLPFVMPKIQGFSPRYDLPPFYEEC